MAVSSVRDDHLDGPWQPILCELALSCMFYSASHTSLRTISKAQYLEIPPLSSFSFSFESAVLPVLGPCVPPRFRPNWDDIIFNTILHIHQPNIIFILVSISHRHRSREIPQFQGHLPRHYTHTDILLSCPCPGSSFRLIPSSLCIDRLSWQADASRSIYQTICQYLLDQRPCCRSLKESSYSKSIPRSLVAFPSRRACLVRRHHRL